MKNKFVGYLMFGVSLIQSKNKPLLLSRGRYWFIFLCLPTSRILTIVFLTAFKNFQFLMSPDKPCTLVHGKTKGLCDNLIKSRYLFLLFFIFLNVQFNMS